MNKRLFGLVLAFVLLISGGAPVHASTVAPLPHLHRTHSAAGGFVGDLQGDWSPEAHAAFDMAINALNAHLQITVPVEVKITLEPLPPETLGRGGSGGSQFGFANAPYPDVWYPNSLANQIAGVRLAPGPDVAVQLNSTLKWDYSGDPQKALKAGVPDFVTTITHEIIHGMGFLGTGDASGSEGKWGDDDGIMEPENLLHQRAGNGFICVVAPAAASQTPRFGPPVPASMTATIADIWDHFVVNGAGESVLNTEHWANPSVELHALLTSDDLFWGGEHGNAANDGKPLKLYAPTAWSNGSSYSHLDDKTYDGGSDAFLTSQGDNIPNINIGPRVLGMLADMGWVVTP
jgi:hypothetical protein